MSSSATYISWENLPNFLRGLVNLLFIFFATDSKKPSLDVSSIKPTRSL